MGKYIGLVIMAAMEHMVLSNLKGNYTIFVFETVLRISYIPTFPLLRSNIIKFILFNLFR